MTGHRRFGRQDDGCGRRKPRVHIPGRLVSHLIGIELSKALHSAAIWGFLAACVLLNVIAAVQLSLSSTDVIREVEQLSADAGATIDDAFIEKASNLKPDGRRDNLLGTSSTAPASLEALRNQLDVFADFNADAVKERRAEQFEGHPHLALEQQLKTDAMAQRAEQLSSSDAALSPLCGQIHQLHS